VGDEYDKAEAEYWATFPAISITRGGIQYKTKENEQMKTTDELMKERDELMQRAQKLDDAIINRHNYGDDPFRNGDILKIMMTYEGSRGSYTYACVKARGRFYLTGKVQAKMVRTFLGENVSYDDVSAGWTWEHFVAWLAVGDASVWRVSKLEKVL
jgi:hypothetical protein